MWVGCFWLQAIAQQSIAANHTSVGALLDDVRQRLASTYPEYIDNSETPQWIFNNAGGAMGSMLVLHAR